MTFKEFYEKWGDPNDLNYAVECVDCSDCGFITLTIFQPRRMRVDSIEIDISDKLEVQKWARCNLFYRILNDPLRLAEGT